MRAGLAAQRVTAMNTAREPGLQALERRAAAAYLRACRADVMHAKPGNVSRAAPAHGMTAQDFLRSARVSAAPMCDLALGVGERVLESVRATHEAVGCNTNLGIVLLCAPLLLAWQRASRAGTLRDALRERLRELDVHDARCAFEAIVLAEPAGLAGSARHDVREPARVSLLQAMREAASRDLVAAQYANDYADVFELGLPALREARARWGCEAGAVAGTYLEFLCAHVDSHVARKHGLTRARELVQRARQCRRAVADCADWQQAQGPLGTLDRDCRQRGINPGTSADLTVAALLAERLGAGVRPAAGAMPGSRQGEASIDDESMG